MSSLAETVLNDPAIRALLEAAGVWLWDCNLLDDTTDYQEGFWEHYGHDPAAMKDTFDFISVMHTRDSQAVTRAWRAHLDGEAESYSARWRMRTGSGEWRWMQAYGRIVERDASGQATRIVGAYTDITEALRAQTNLETYVAEINAVFNGTQDGLVFVAPDLTIMRINEAAVAVIERFTGYRASAGDDVAAVPPSTEGRFLFLDIREALAGRLLRPREFHRREAGLWVEASLQAIHSANGAILGVAVTLRDVTERRNTELARANTLRMESLGLMASGIAHDFNNLLSAILGNVELAKMSISNADATIALDEARAAALRAGELVGRLLQFAGKQEPVTSVVDLSALAREICRYAGKMSGYTVPVSEDLAENLPLISADATQLRQLILNLVVNALDATRDSGSEVVVRTLIVPEPEALVPDVLLEPRPAPAYLALQVRDDGEGMDDYTIEHLWDLFFTTKEAGHGLGLASVLGAVRSHGGTVSVQSSAGAGSTFSIFLPCGVSPL